MKEREALVGSALFFLAAPAAVAGLVPWLIGRSTGTNAPWPVQVLGLAVALVGLVALLVCFAGFVAARGTPAPVAPTERLVVEGLYCYVRNPMYLAVITIIVGHALWQGSLWVLAYGAAVATGTAAFVRFYEEPALRRRFGAEYDVYRAGVPAWMPRVRPWRRPVAG